jgi:hypothetical protein
MTEGYEALRKRQRPGLIMLFGLIVFLLLTGCAPARQAFRIQPAGQWQEAGIAGREFQTDHYLIHTTIEDGQTVRRFATVLEAGYAQYQQLAPGIPLSQHPFHAFYFARHDEWAAHTIATTGNDADAYLSVFNGGYTWRDEIVCWLGNEPDTLLTCAHEGLHQFIARNFRRRLPPALEEGLASTYENLSINETEVTFDLVHNPRRQKALRDAVEQGWLIPLETLILLHAGDLRDRDPALKEIYYAQCWALAVMLRREPQYRSGFEHLLKATATGNQTIDIGPGDGSSLYHADRIRSLLQQHLAPDWEKFTSDYQRIVRQLAE